MDGPESKVVPDANFSADTEMRQSSKPVMSRTPLMTYGWALPLVSLATTGRSPIPSTLDLEPVTAPVM